MTADPPDVSVIIPHYENLSGLDICLAAVCNQTAVRTRSVEIIVADNNSPSGLAAVEAVVRDRARVILAAEKGAGPARNAGIAAARGAILAFTDSDCIPDEHWLESGLACLEEVDLVGGCMTVLVRSETSMSGAEAFEKVFAFNNLDYVKRKGFTVTANLFCRSSTAVAIGPFGIGVSEDKEWCQRGTKLGMTIGYAPNAIVGHPARRTWDELLSKWRRIDQETYQLWRANKKSVVSWIVYTWLLPVSIAPHSIKVLTSRSVSGIGNRMRAMTTLVAHRFWRFWDQQRLVFLSKS